MLMVNVGVSSATMELVPLLCLCLLSRSGSTFGDGNGNKDGPDVVNVVVKEGNDAILPCSLSTKENIVQGLFDWKKDGQKEVFMYDAGVHYNNGRAGQDEPFKGRVFHFPELLTFGNASIVIKNTKVTDSGSYTCDFPRLQSVRKSRIILVVEPFLRDRTEENISGATSQPSVKSLTETRYWSLLQCLVRGASPKPKLQWQDSSGNMVPAKEPQVTERGGSYDIILQTNVTKSDHYRCVATQEEINHTIYTETDVYIHGKATSSSTVAIPWVICFGVFLGLLVT